MSFRNDCHSSANEQQSSGTDALQLPGLITQLPPVEQLPFPENTLLAVGALERKKNTQGLQEQQISQLSPISDVLPAVSTTQQLADPTTPTPPAVSPSVTIQLPFPGSPRVTRQLTSLEIGALAPVKKTPRVERQPLIIRATGRKKVPLQRPPDGRRWVINLAVLAAVLLVSFGTLMAVIPTSRVGELAFHPFQPILNWAKGNSNNNPTLLAQQAATITAVTRDGYDAGPGHTYAGLPTAPPSSNGGGSGNGGGGGSGGSGNGNNFTYGQCTFWAAMRYHELAGAWIPWSGDAYAWAYQAAQYGWHVSSVPPRGIPSIIVLQAYAEGAGGFGHVAVVESVNADGSVYASNFNWYTNGGGWARLSYWTFSPGPGVSFIWR